MRLTTLLTLIITTVMAGRAAAQVLTPRQALGEAPPAPGTPEYYSTLTPVDPRHNANCSPSRASTMFSSFSSAIRTGAARVWYVRVGTDTYAVIWRRGQERYRPVQLVESRSGHVAQRPIGKQLSYSTKQEAADAIVAHLQKRMDADAPPHFALAGHHLNAEVAHRAPATPIKKARS